MKMEAKAPINVEQRNATQEKSHVTILQERCYFNQTQIIFVTAPSPPKGKLYAAGYSALGVVACKN